MGGMSDKGNEKKIELSCSRYRAVAGDTTWDRGPAMLDIFLSSL